MDTKSFLDKSNITQAKTIGEVLALAVPFNSNRKLY